jgi:hypothetical protein
VEASVTTTFLDPAVLDSFSVDDFLARRPFPWHDFEHVLLPDAFEALIDDFPSRDLFEWHEGRSGQHYQRPQDRWFLTYSAKLPPKPGVAGPAQLPAVWREFIGELEANETYRKLIEASLGRSDLRMSYNWHLGVQGSEVCPHLDKDSKIGTHIFYLNTERDWDRAWGGATLVLSDRSPASDPGSDDPDFSDFGATTPVDNLGNHSFFFRNTPDAWHGVKPLTSPEGTFRRLFNVVYESNPQTGGTASPLGRLRHKAARVLGSRPKA